jgi:hypothetical protein
LIFDQDFAFAVLQSQIHESWALFFGGDRKDWLVYTASDCFETYPFPSCDTSRLDNIGNQYYRCRDEYSRTFNIGLTDYHNRFHDPHEQSSEILHLRELHAAMDRAVLEAYGWHDLAATARCEFLLDYEEEGDRDLGSGFGEDSQSPTPKPQSRRRKPYRLRWPDDFRDEVLARLLELNEQRHKEELLAGKAGVGCRVSGAGDENGDDEEFTTDDEDVDAPRSQKQAKTSAAKPKAPRKSKKAPATGQQKMDFS